MEWNRYGIPRYDMDTGTAVGCGCAPGDISDGEGAGEGLAEFVVKQEHETAVSGEDVLSMYPVA